MTPYSAEREGMYPVQMKGKQKASDEPVDQLHVADHVSESGS